MPIYGLNFNSTAIPPHLSRPFTERMKRLECGHENTFNERVGRYTGCNVCRTQQKVVWFRLQGVGTSQAEAVTMQVVANNGHRKIHVEKRNNGAIDVWGIFTY